MKIRFIGTGSGKTSLFRYHSSLMISNQDFNLLIDSGDAISRALLAQNIPYNSINGILLSHLHPDHYSGFAELIVQMKMNKRSQNLSVYVHHTLIKSLKEYLNSSYIFMERIGFPIDFVGFNTDEQISVSTGLSFIPRQNTHLQEYEVYDSSLSFACCSFLFNSEGENIYYSGDVGSVEDLFLFKDFKIKYFITEVAHVSIREIINTSELLKPDKVILTHINDEDVSGLKLHLENFKNISFIIAEDGLILGA